MFSADFDPLLQLNENTAMVDRLISSHNAHDELLLAYSQNNADMAKLIRKQDIRIRSLENQMKALIKIYETISTPTDNS